MKRIDERDVMFSRMNYKKGTKEYRDYYERNPNKKEIDDVLRDMPNIGGEGTATYDPINSPIMDACFRFLGDIKKLSEGEINNKKVDEIDPVTMTKKLKSLSKYYNAQLVGITEMKEYHYYSHRGRETKDYGQKIENYHKYGIVFAVEMEKEMIFRAPQIAESVAVTKGYIQAAIIGMVLSYYIRELGYDARNHMDGNYLTVLPLVARDAGLGDIGRSGLLVTKEFGSRVRLGVVTTDLPLICDERDEFGLEEFCSVCNRCVRTCPGKAIPSGEKKEIEGTKRWQIQSEECYRRWRALGTDCGICLANCPFSDEIPKELIENIGKPSVREKILKEYNKKHGIRPIIREKPDWLK
ncbi:4Fe-4S dicluster domain-containing protein [Crassaminicella profunda]|uniref:4Fe-4S dicluster domain-containing protein n=1 Tax=Crassaminicella profunda TaxID=1286698 RepID=UPI001CA7A446|nr:reductive dehalogenase domain-containing protein [Crassaminicella profunda]QZY57254.1 4Fe-4S dicluster domain-containing protein [Crassaminicella profunda]